MKMTKIYDKDNLKPIIELDYLYKPFGDVIRVNDRVYTITKVIDHFTSSPKITHTRIIYLKKI